MAKKITGIFFLIGLCLSSALFFRDFLTNFFFQDDFFNITLSQNQSLISAFNIFQKPILNFFFYRPLTTQAFWGLQYPLFGFNPLPYHLVALTFFILNIVLVYKLCSLLTDRKSVHYLTTFLYAFSSTHFYRLFFLSQFQEIGLATFSLLTIIFFIKRSKLALVFFIIALMCKETAIMIPVILLIYTFLFKKKQYLLVASHFAILILYISARLLFFGFDTGSTYHYDINPLHVLNNYSWYTLWTIGIPESFVNLKLFFVSKFAENGQFQSFSVINPDIFTSFGIWGGPIVLVFMLFIFTLVLSVKRDDLKKIIERETIFAELFFLLFILPVGFFPFHKFAYSLTLPIFGAYFLLAKLISDFELRNQFLAVTLFVVLSFFTLQYNLTSHWATGKAYTGQKSFSFLEQNYPDISQFNNIYFQNDDRNYCSLQKPGKDLSSEVAYGVGGLEGLRLLYNKPDLEVYYYDWDKNKHLSGNSLVLDSRLFLRR